MAQADAAVLDLPPQAPSRRFHALTATETTAEGVAPISHDFALAVPIRVLAGDPLASMRPRWIPSAEAPPLGLGPSVAELTLGRPPRAPRPGE